MYLYFGICNLIVIFSVVYLWRIIGYSNLCVFIGVVNVIVKVDIFNLYVIIYIGNLCGIFSGCDFGVIFIIVDASMIVVAGKLIVKWFFFGVCG